MLVVGSQASFIITHMRRCQLVKLSLFEPKFLIKIENLNQTGIKVLVLHRDLQSQQVCIGQAFHWYYRQDTDSGLSMPLCLV